MLDRRTARGAEPPRDWNGASRAVADVYFPHTLTVTGGGEPRLTLNSLDLGPAVIGHVGWGADVAVECDYPHSYELNIPLTGHLVSRGRHGTITSTPGDARIFRADSPCLIEHWDATCIVVGVKFDSSYLQAEAERVLATERSVGEFVPEQLSLTEGAGRGLRQLIASLSAHVRESDLFDGLDVVRTQLTGALAAAMLLASSPDDEHRPAPQPRAIRRVTAAVHDEPERPWTVGEMAALAGVSVRRLQEGFRASVGCSPMEYLVDVRVRRARQNLLADPTVTVSDAAAHWGFSSASRFAAAYRSRYGLSPSAERRG